MLHLLIYLITIIKQIRDSKTLGIFEANLLLLLDRFLAAGVINEVWALLLEDGHEVAADEEAVQQLVAHFDFFDGAH